MWGEEKNFLLLVTIRRKEWKKGNPKREGRILALQAQSLFIVGKGGRKKSFVTSHP